MIEQLDLPLGLPPLANIPDLRQLGDFLRELEVKRGTSYGWRTDLLSACSHSTRYCHMSTDLLLAWCKAKLVPGWAFIMVAELSFTGKRKMVQCTKWDKGEMQFLILEYQQTAGEPTNKVLASRCSVQFGRMITENAIKGQLDRCRKANLIEGLRYGR